MPVKRENFLKAYEEISKDKGKRKFTQSVDVMFNFRGIDFSKPENRLNLEVTLPKGRGREYPVVFFGDGDAAMTAKKLGATVYTSEEIPKLSPSALKKQADAVFIAQPNLMATVGKLFGAVLAPRNKLPYPLRGDVKSSIESAKKTIRIKSKGKYLPVAHAVIGTEQMSPDDLYENFEAVYEKIAGKVGEHNIKSVYIKMTMGSPAKIEIR